MTANRVDSFVQLFASRASITADASASSASTAMDVDDDSFAEKDVPSVRMQKKLSWKDEGGGGLVEVLSERPSPCSPSGSPPHSPSWGWFTGNSPSPPEAFAYASRGFHYQPSSNETRLRAWASA